MQTELAPAKVRLSDELGQLPERDLVARLRLQWPDTPYHRDSLHREAANEIERLRAALGVVRQYPDFDGGGPLPEMIDQVLCGAPSPMLDFLDRL